MGNDPFLTCVDNAHNTYQSLLQTPSSTLNQVSDASYKWQCLKADYPKRDRSLTVEAWEKQINLKVQMDNHYENTSNMREAYDKKIEEMEMFGAAININPELVQTAWPKKKRGPYGLWFPDSIKNVNLQIALERFDAELQIWMAEHPVDAKFLAQSKEDTLYEFIISRPGPFILLRLTQPASAPGAGPVGGAPGFEPAVDTLDQIILTVRKKEFDRLPGESEGTFREDRLPPILNSDQIGSQASKTTVYPKLYQEVQAPTTPHEHIGDAEDVEPLSHVVIDMAISCAPFGIGQAYTGLEVLIGYNIFGHKLSNTDKAILAAAILVPYAVKGARLAIRLGKAGVEAKMAKTAVQEAAKAASQLMKPGEETLAKITLGESEISKIMTATEDAVKEANVIGKEASVIATQEEAVRKAAAAELAAMEKATAAQQAAAKMAALGSKAMENILQVARSICKGQKLTPAQTEQALKILRELVGIQPVLVRKLTAQSLEALIKIMKKFPDLLNLDARALERILSRVRDMNVAGKGITGVLSALKGAIVEEVFYATILPVTRGGGARFLSNLLRLPSGGVLRNLQYIAGHVIEDGGRRLLTDGIIGIREVVEIGGKQVYRFRIFAIIEIKAGESGARELARRSAKVLADLPADVQAEIIAKSEVMFADMTRLAAERGASQPVMKLAEVVADNVKNFLDPASQVVKDLSRLMPEAGVAKKIFINGVEHEVVLEESVQFLGISPSDTNLFGIDTILGKDTITPAYQAAEALLRANGILFTWFPLKMTYSELNQIAKVFYDFLLLMRP